MTKTPKRISVGQILDKQDSARTYNEVDSGLLYNDQDQGIRTQIEGADREVLTDTQTQTMSAKTVTLSTVESSAINSCTLSQSVFNVDNNTLTNVEVDNLKSGVLLTTTVSVSINDANLFSAKAIKDYVDLQDSGISGSISSHISDTTGAHAASAISNVPSGNLVATDVQAALNELQSDVDTRELASNKGAANGYCPLGADQKVSATYLPSYVDDVVEVANFAALPVTGESGKIYVTLDTNLTYRWSGSAYVEISQSLALGETSTTAYRGDRGATAYSHSQTTTGIHGLTGAPAGTSDTQVFTNKDYDGGTAADNRRITLPKNTLANLNGLTRKEGTIAYATDTDKVYYDDGTNLTAVGSGSGSGSLSTYAQLKSDDDTGTWATGNNATFLGGGSIAGTFTKQNATNPLNGTYSYTYTQAAGSLNDYFVSDVVTVPLRAKNSSTTATNLCRLKATYDGASGDIRAIVYDVTNAAILTGVSQTFPLNADYNKKVEFLFEIPATCTQLKFGGQVLVLNSGKVLKFDDIEFIDDPFQSVQTVEQESLEVYGNAGTSVTANVTDIPFTTTASNKLYVLGTWTNNTTYTALKKQTVSFSAGVRTSTSVATDLVIYKNNSNSLLVGDYITSSVHTISRSIVLEAGDFITLRSSGSITLNNALSDHRLVITATAITDNVVQAYQDGTEWTSYTPAIQGATLSSSYVKAKRSGSNLLIDFYLNLTSTTVSELRMYFPTWANATSHTNTVGLGSVNNNIAAASFNGVPSIQAMISSGANYIQFGTTNTANSSLTALAGNYFGAGYVLSGQVSIPIAGWSSTPTLLALPTSKENRFEAEFAAAGTISKTNNNVFGTAVVTGTSIFTIPLTAGTFTTAPIPKVTIVSPTTLGAAGKIAIVESVSTTSLVIKTGTIDSSGFIQASALPFAVELTKASPDYKAPGVHVGELSGQWQYDISSYVTSSPAVSSMFRAVAVVTKCDSGQYRMKFNISYTVASGSRTSATATISGTTFKNGVDQAGTGFPSSGQVNAVIAVNNTGNITMNHGSATTTQYWFSGDVELESRPTWASNTPS